MAHFISNFFKHRQLKSSGYIKMKTLSRWKGCYFHITGNCINSEIGYFRIVTIVIKNIDQVNCPVGSSVFLS
jgi:hypothetical protein